MHDTFLNQNLYDAIVRLCGENSISKIDDIIITVHTDSHICEDSLRKQFVESGNNLIDDSTGITVQKKIYSVLPHSSNISAVKKNAQ